MPDPPARMMPLRVMVGFLLFDVFNHGECVVDAILPCWECEVKRVLELVAVQP